MYEGNDLKINNVRLIYLINLITKYFQFSLG
jgi:hypothetical protein